MATLGTPWTCVSGTADGDARRPGRSPRGPGPRLGIAGRWADAARLANEALALATRLGRPLVESSARTRSATQWRWRARWTRASRTRREWIRIAREHDSPLDVALGRVDLADALHALGRSAEAREVAEEGRRAIAGRRRSCATRWID